ncbi:MAG: alpha/beta hydrolase [Alphaproteobacteria bacterium]
MRYFAAAFAGLVLAGCSPLSLVNSLVPSDGYSRARDIAYGAGPRQRLNVYQGKQHPGPSPVIVFLYGGSWKNGNRGDYEFVGEAFTRHGFTVVVPDYRVYPDVKFPEFVKDAARAVRWTRDNIGTFGGDPKRIFIAGHSAGAHIAALLALDARYLNAVGMKRGAICGLVGLAGPYAFDPLGTRSVRPIFAHLADPNTARPITFADGRAPPSLLFHGADDTVVLPSNSRRLARALKRDGVPVSLNILPEIGHIGLLLSLARPFDHWAPVHGPIAKFVRDNADCRR